jgi:hypothetical protein
MNDRAVLPVTSLVSLLLFSIHITDDIVHGLDRWGPRSLFGVLILAVWLYAALVWPDRRAGRIILFLGGLAGALMPVIHMRGDFAKSKGAFLFLWTLFALGASGAVTVALALRGFRSPGGRGSIMTAAEHENPDRRG